MTLYTPHCTHSIFAGNPLESTHPNTIAQPKLGYMTQGRGRPETTQLLRAKLGFRDDMLWKRFCARRLELIHSLSLSSRKASEQEEPVHFVARKLCSEYGYNPEGVLPDFEKLVRAGIQSVRRNQRRFTRGTNKEGKPVLLKSSSAGEDSVVGSPGSPGSNDAVTPGGKPTGIVAALQELQAYILPLMVSNSSITPATPMIREGFFQLTVGATCAANGLDNFAPILYDAVLGDLGDAMVRFFNVSQRKVLSPLLANAVVLHGTEVAFAFQSVLSELVLAAGSDVDEMIEVLNRLEVPSVLPPIRSSYRRSDESSYSPGNTRDTSLSPQPDTPKSLQVSPVVRPTSGNEFPTNHDTAPQVQPINTAVKPMLASENYQSASPTKAPAPPPNLGPFAGTPSQPGTPVVKPEQEQLNAAATLASGFSVSMPQQNPPPPQPLMPMLNNSAAPPPMLPSLSSFPIRGQWGAMPTMFERRVTIYYNGRHLSLIYSPLKNTPPTISELIEHSRKTFTIAPDAVVRVRDLLSKRILETQQDLLDVFSQQVVDLELFLPPPMMVVAPPPSNEAPRFTPLAPVLLRSDQKPVQ